MKHPAWYEGFLMQAGKEGAKLISVAFSPELLVAIESF